MSKEIVSGIGKAIEEAQRAKNLREQKETVKRETERLTQEAERRALIARNEARLRATGVVDLFKELRDSKVLMMTETGEPAKVEWLCDICVFSNGSPKWESDKLGISIEFDKHWVRSFAANPDTGYHDLNEHTRLLKAKITEKGVLVISQHEIKQGEILGDVVRDEILRLKGLKE